MVGAKDIISELDSREYNDNILNGIDLRWNAGKAWIAT